ncbi:MAG: Ig-like domain-containing protein [Actinomycetaceae bacterium]|nr:Ig-like domain-containing protein [Actinomycetaceae bacterium]
MKKARLLAGVPALALVLSLMPAAYAADPPDANLGVDLGGGTTVYTEATPSSTSDCMAAVKKWRQDALDTNVLWSSNTGTTTMREYLQENGIDEADYLAPQWSQDIEKIALTRSVEQEATGLWDHKRPNGESIFGISSHGITGNAEVLAVYPTTCTQAIDLWASEKKDWVDNTGAETGHYEYLINPSIYFYGMAGINGYWTGQGTTAKNISTDTTPLAFSGTYIFPVKVKASDVTADKLNVDASTVIVGQTISPRVTPNDTNLKYSVRGTWSVADTSKASVADGVITGLAEGTTQMTLTTEDGTDITFPLTVRALQITSVTNPEQVTTESGTKPVLPDSVTVTYEDDSSGTAPVTWGEYEDALWKAREGGTFTVTGTVAGTDKKATVEVKVNPATITSVKPERPTTTVDSGTDPQSLLPTTAVVTWSNGDTTDSPEINWESFSTDIWKGRNSRSVDISGTVVVAGQQYTVNHQIIVKAATVTSVETPAELTTPEEVAPVLPQTLKLTWSNGDVTNENVTWEAVDPGLYATAPTTFTVDGTIDYQVDGVDTTKPTSITVNVVQAVIESVATPDAVDTESGTAPVLPSTVKTTWSNGDVTDQAVTWDDYDDALWKAREGGTFDVNGTVSGTDKKVTITVNVAPAVIESAVNPATVTTESGTAPVLPSTVKTTWSNGDVTDQAVTWDDYDDALWQAREGGTFDVNGTVDDSSQASNSRIASRSLNVSNLMRSAQKSPTTVTVTVIVRPATIVNVDNPQDTQVEVGTIPALPPTVSAEYSNGDVVQVPVTWDAVEASDVAQPRQFDLQGSVEGYDDPVTIHITVADEASDAPAPKPEKEKKQSTLAKTGVDSGILVLLVITLMGAGVALRSFSSGRQQCRCCL